MEGRQNHGGTSWGTKTESGLAVHNRRRRRNLLFMILSRHDSVFRGGARIPRRLRTTSPMAVQRSIMFCAACAFRGYYRVLAVRRPQSGFPLLRNELCQRGRASGVGDHCHSTAADRSQILNSVPWSSGLAVSSRLVTSTRPPN